MDMGQEIQLCCWGSVGPDWGRRRGSGRGGGGGKMGQLVWFIRAGRGEAVNANLGEFEEVPIWFMSAGSPSL